MHDKATVGFLTIGNSPRPDIMMDIAPILSAHCEILEMGALDDLSGAEFDEVRPTDSESFYVTRGRDGELTVARRWLYHRVSECISKLEEKGADIIALSCTGEFPEMESHQPLLIASRIIKSAVTKAYTGVPLAIVIPDEGQREYMALRWESVGIKHTMFCCSPYEETEESRAVCREISRAPYDFVVLDCMGFPISMAEAFERKTGKRVLLPRRLLCEEILKRIPGIPASVMQRTAAGDRDDG